MPHSTDEMYRSRRSSVEVFIPPSVRALSHENIDQRIKRTRHRCKRALGAALQCRAGVISCLFWKASLSDGARGMGAEVVP